MLLNASRKSSELGPPTSSATPPMHELDPSTQVDVTASIVNHANRGELLECLRSLYGDTQHRCSLEIVVVDNASGDGSVEAVQTEFPDVRVIENTRRLVFGANHNRAARVARGRLIFFLNPDTVVRPGTLDALVDHLDKHPRVAVAGPPIFRADGTLETFLLRFPTLRKSLRDALRPWRAPGRWDGRDETVVDWVNGCALMVRRSALGQDNPFDEGFFLYGEEKDLCRRLADAGYETRLR